MSHVTLITDLDVRDLDALAAAARELGGELVRDVTSFRWFGSSVGDYPLPAGFTEQDLGKCEHVIRFADARYEIGVCRRRDGRAGYVLMYDFWGPGRKLADRIGADGGKLRQAYGVEVARRELLRQGCHVQTVTTTDGRVVLTATGGRAMTGIGGGR